MISYYLRDKQEGGARVTIGDIRGETLATLKGPSEVGMNCVTWNMRRASEGGGGRGFGAQVRRCRPD